MVLEFERAPAGSVCTRENIVWTKAYSEHQPGKYRVKVRTGSTSNIIRCVACSYPVEREAIRDVSRREEDDELGRLAAKVQRLSRSPAQRYWPWAVLTVGGLALVLTWWLVAGGIGLFTLLAFAFVAPVPCRSTADEEKCEEWGRGFLRACPDPEHGRRQRDLLREAWRGQHRPRLIWDDVLARGALAGAWASLALIAVASVCYLSTVIF
ncbi:hypothetical protein [Cryptosporangium minutisporangium]|uniref:Uncharacterized protein n=1 Tax=Cryptosporangium minutisporangium TaxID=113569 RepID=A0ABP6STL4_9ACTN